MKKALRHFDIGIYHGTATRQVYSIYSGDYLWIWDHNTNEMLFI